MSERISAAGMSFKPNKETFCVDCFFEMPKELMEKLHFDSDAQMKEILFSNGGRIDDDGTGHIKISSIHMAFIHPNTKEMELWQKLMMMQVGWFLGNVGIGNVRQVMTIPPNADKELVDKMMELAKQHIQQKVDQEEKSKQETDHATPESGL